MPYKDTRADFEYLETLKPLADWYGLEEDMVEFMRKPTKEYARKKYVQAITMWFQEYGPVADFRATNIADKYSLEIITA